MRFFFQTILVLSLWISSLAHCESNPAFWVVSKGAAKVYLFGSMHFGASDFYPLPSQVTDAFNHSQKLVVEVDVSRILPAEAMQAVFKYGSLPLGATLKTTLSSEVFLLLEKQCKLNGLPVSAFERFQPWFVALQLVEAEIKKTELQPQLGIDLYFLNKGGKVVDQLESIDSQLALFGRFTLQEQEQFLKQTLLDLSDSKDYLLTMASAWKTGDMDALEKKMIAPFKESENTYKLYDALFTKRNIEMTNAVMQYLNEPGKVFFVVGAGHMIGSGGIVSRLKKKGFDVRRVDYKIRSK